MMGRFKRKGRWRRYNNNNHGGQHGTDASGHDDDTTEESKLTQSEISNIDTSEEVERGSNELKPKRICSSSFSASKKANMKNQLESDKNDLKQKKKVSGSFNSFEQGIIKDYLLQYRNGAEKRYNGVHDSKSGAPRCDGQKYSILPQNGGEQNNNENFRFEKLSICGHMFPALTEDILELPYLALPSTLGNKHRKAIYNICLDVGLYHTGTGNISIPADRQAVVSIYPDGFDHVPNLEIPTSFPVIQCKPWFYRNDLCAIDSSDTSLNPHLKSRRLVQDSTKNGREMIESLIDQPGKCLRDGVDFIDFHKVENEDLSNVSEPDIYKNAIDNNDSIFVLIDSTIKMKKCLKDILEDAYPNEIAFDLEMYNESKFVQATCLLQLATDTGKEYVIDVLAPGVWDMVSSLAPVFADRSVVKVGHGIQSMDISSLHRDFGIFVVNVFDTQVAASKLSLQKYLGLANLCEFYGLRGECRKQYIALKKLYQRQDWRKRPLTNEMITYGLYDVHYLLKLRQILIRDLTIQELWQNPTGRNKIEDIQVKNSLSLINKKAETYENGDDEVSGRAYGLNVTDVGCDGDDSEGYFTPNEEDEEGNKVSNHVLFNSDIEKDKESTFQAKDLRKHIDLMSVLTTSQQHCLSFWKNHIESPKKNNLLNQVVGKLDESRGELWGDSEIRCFNLLLSWRDQVAKSEGILTGMVCSIDLLVLVVLNSPTCKENLRRYCYFLPQILDQESTNKYLEEMFEIVSLNSMAKQDKHVIIYYKRKGKDSSKSGTKIHGGQSSDLKLFSYALLKWTSIFAGITVFWLGRLRFKRR